MKHQNRVWYKVYLVFHGLVALYHLYFPLALQVLLVPVAIIASVVIGATQCRQISWSNDLFGEDG